MVKTSQSSFKICQGSPTSLPVPIQHDSNHKSGFLIKPTESFKIDLNFMEPKKNHILKFYNQLKLLKSLTRKG